MLERTFLVVVSTPDQESAYRIFSVMNARGLDLSPTDIFKADIIGAIHEDQQDTYADKWDSEESDLGRDGFTDLFRDIRTISTRERAKRELLKEFPEQVLNNYLSAGKATNFVDEVLVPFSDAFELAEILLLRGVQSGVGDGQRVAAPPATTRQQGLATAGSVGLTPPPARPRLS